ncbi:hypothetical protein SynBIOSU31_01943 [Synechococcus sp. BIOS-U3-1]|nr:hypothetical protein [Synechococcus sp. CPC100]QNI58810.1 hypothetical protein SynBIOSU31_01943 [Synechococcus sp. BIOS-U3-1]
MTSHRQARCDKKPQSSFNNAQSMLSSGKIGSVQADCTRREGLNLNLNHGFFSVGDCLDDGSCHLWGWHL